MSHHLAAGPIVARRVGPDDALRAIVARIGRQFVGDIHIILKPPAGCLLAQVDGDAFERELVDPAVILATQAGYVGTMTTAD